VRGYFLSASHPEFLSKLSTGRAPVLALKLDARPNRAAAAITWGYASSRRSNEGKIKDGGKSGYSSGRLLRLIQTGRNPNFAAPATSHLFEDWNDICAGSSRHCWMIIS